MYNLVEHYFKSSPPSSSVCNFTFHQFSFIQLTYVINVFNFRFKYLSRYAPVFEEDVKVEIILSLTVERLSDKWLWQCQAQSG